jgi:hypothetical protein
MQVKEHAPPRVPELSEVRAQAEDRYTLETAMEAAMAAATDAERDLKAGRAWAEVSRRAPIGTPTAQFVSRADRTVPAEIISAAFNLTRPTEDQPVWGVARLPDGNAAVVEVSSSRSSTRALALEDRAARGLQHWQASARSTVSAYLEAIRGAAEVIRNEELFEVN